MTDIRLNYASAHKNHNYVVYYSFFFAHARLSLLRLKIFFLSSDFSVSTMSYVVILVSLHANHRIYFVTKATIANAFEMSRNVFDDESCDR